MVSQGIPRSLKTSRRIFGSAMRRTSPDVSSSGEHVTSCITYFSGGSFKGGSGARVLRRQGFIDQSVLGWSLSYTTASAALLFREGLPLSHLHSRLLSLALFACSIYGSPALPRPSSSPLPDQSQRYALSIATLSLPRNVKSVKRFAHGANTLLRSCRRSIDTPPSFKAMLCENDAETFLLISFISVFRRFTCERDATGASASRPEVHQRM